ncbi:primosomal protein N' [Patescibacteria group bacterium]|nr:primosomal protein N' [Patescibacteria group bacterium]MBU0963506.1 primosomal protein N' [Patescibacteria group bacterium]
MFAEIILSRRFPKHIGIFDYQIPKVYAKQIKIGQLVTIPFRKSEVEGIIIKIKEQGIAGKNIKEIINITNPDPIIIPNQILLAEWMSRYYFVSLGTIIKMMLPPIPKKIHATKYQYKSAYPPVISSEIKDALNLIKKQQAASTFVQITDHLEKEQFIFGLINKNKGTKLIIVPEINQINKIINIFPKAYQEKIAIIHSQLNKNEFYKTYKLILENKAELIIGTKLGIFAPFQNLKAIIIDHEEDDNHKQSDQNPRFDARTACQQLSKIYKSKLIYLSHSHSVETYAQIKNQEIVNLQSKTAIKRPVSIINMRDERKKRNYSVFSDKLHEEIDKAIANKKKVFLFINKRGSASSVICQDCGNILDCNQCQQPLMYHEKGSLLYCHNCNSKSELPPFCPKCSGPNFKFTGLGTQKIEKEANKFWPKQKIIRIDKDEKEINIPANYNIIIGTSRAIHVLDWDAISLVGIVSADTFLYLPDFRASEKTWHLMHNIAYYSSCPIIIQTYNSEHPAINLFKISDNKNFYKNELEERKSLKYPPFSQLIKLTYQNKDKNECLNETMRLLRILKSSPCEASILTPLIPFQRGQWRMYIILKCELSLKKNLLDNIINTVPDNWIIDRDPVNLL